MGVRSILLAAGMLVLALLIGVGVEYWHCMARRNLSLASEPGRKNVTTGRMAADCAGCRSMNGCQQLLRTEQARTASRQPRLPGSGSRDRRSLAGCRGGA